MHTLDPFKFITMRFGAVLSFIRDDIVLNTKIRLFFLAFVIFMSQNYESPHLYVVDDTFGSFNFPEGEVYFILISILSSPHLEG